MIETNRKEQKIIGEKIRTRNGNMEEIVGLWTKVSELDLRGNLFAVYFNYESDHTGEFDFLIGTETYKSVESVDLIAGKYLVMSILNGTPEKVGEAWQKIWQDDVIYNSRLFTTDFEEYLPTGEVKIYLAIK